MSSFNFGKNIQALITSISSYYELSESQTIEMAIILLDQFYVNNRVGNKIAILDKDNNVINEIVFNPK